MKPYQRSQRVDANSLNKLLEDGFVEMLRSPLRHALQGNGWWPGFFVGAIRCDGVIDIADGRHASQQADFFQPQAIGVTAAIDFFVMMQTGVGDRFIQPLRLQNFIASARVGLHDVPFLGIQGARLVQHLQWDLRFANVMHQPCNACLMNLMLIQIHATGQTNHQGTHSDAVHVGVVVRSLQAHQADQCMRVALNGLRHLLHQQARGGKVDGMAKAYIVKHVFEDITCLADDLPGLKQLHAGGGGL